MKKKIEGGSQNGMIIKFKKYLFKDISHTIGMFVVGGILILAGLAMAFSQEFNMNSSYKKISLSQLKTQLINTPLPSGTNSNSYHAPNNHGQYGLQSCHMIGESSNEYIIDFHNLGLINDLTTAGHQRPWFRPQWTFNVGGNIPAGKYRVGLEAFDGYATRNQTQGQNHERYRVLFKQNGHVVATSGYTSDVPDNIKAAKVVMTVNNELNIPDFNQVTIEHYAVAHGNTGSADSVRAICMQLIPIPQGTITASELEAKDVCPGKPIHIIGTSTTTGDAHTVAHRLVTGSNCFDNTKTFAWSQSPEVSGGEHNWDSAHPNIISYTNESGIATPGEYTIGYTSWAKDSNGNNISSNCKTTTYKVLSADDPQCTVPSAPSCTSVFSPGNITASNDTHTAKFNLKVSDNTTDVSTVCTGYPKDEFNKTYDLNLSLSQLKTSTGKDFWNEQLTYSVAGSRHCVTTVKNASGQIGTCSADINVTEAPQTAPTCTASFDPTSLTKSSNLNTANFHLKVSDNVTDVSAHSDYYDGSALQFSEHQFISNGQGTFGAPGRTLAVLKSGISIPNTNGSYDKVGTRHVVVTVKNASGQIGTCSADIEVVDNNNNNNNNNSNNNDNNNDNNNNEVEEESCNSSIGNYIWYDTNGNGIQEDIEEGIEGIKVCAFKGDKKYCDTTNKHGRYKIKDLCAGNYDVRVKGVGGMVQTYDPDGQKDNRTKVKLKNKDDHTKADFGYKGGAPKTGVATNIALLIGLSTLITIGILIVMRRKGAL